MSSLKIYCHPTCSTCKKALSIIRSRISDIEIVNLLEEAPNKNELKLMLKSVDGNIRKIMNTSGDLYREMNMKDKVPEMSEGEILDMLTKHGMLVKRPFIIHNDKGIVGFNEETLNELLSEIEEI